MHLLHTCMCSFIPLCIFVCAKVCASLYAHTGVCECVFACVCVRACVSWEVGGGGVHVVGVHPC